MTLIRAVAHPCAICGNSAQMAVQIPYTLAPPETVWFRRVQFHALTLWHCREHSQQALIDRARAMFAEMGLELR